MALEKGPIYGEVGYVRNALKALGTAIAVLALCAPLILWPAEDPRSSLAGAPGVTLTVPATVIVSTTLSPSQTTTTTTEPAPEPPVTTTTTTLPTPITITVAIAGDVITDEAVMASVRSRGTGAHDFTPVLAPIAPYLRAADYTVACLEPRLAGAEFGYGDSPVFNSPRELAFALRTAGVDLVATANRHSFDFGRQGVLNTLDRLEAAGLAYVGTHRSPKERATPRVVDIRGVKVAFLNYTDRVDRASALAREATPSVAMIDPEVILQDAKMARVWGADAVVVILNYGEPMASQPTEEQMALTRQILSFGVDVIVGTRPAVQTIAHIVTYSSWQVTDKFVAYSLGDLLSGGRFDSPGFGFILYLHLKKDGLRTFLTGVGYLPVYVQSAPVTSVAGDEGTAFRVLPVVPGLVPESDLPLSEEDRRRMAQLWEDLRDLLYRPDENIIPFVAGPSSR